MLHWSKEEAREYLVNYHFLNQKNSPTLIDVFERLQTIQNDPLSVVGHNQELVLQSRIKGFKKQDLYNALYKDRILVDGWDKQASIFMKKDYPLLKHIRTRLTTIKKDSIQKYLGFNVLDHIDEVMDIVKKDGPIFSKDIQTGETIQTGWWSTKPSSMAIDYLFYKGDLGIESRNHTQKKYDLIERLIDNHDMETPFETENEFMEYFLLRRIKAMGLTWNKSGNQYADIYLNNKSKRSSVLKSLIRKKLIEEIRIEGFDETCYIPFEAKEYPIKVENRVVFLAPLDNMLWDRDMLRDLFGFDYIWEVYTPKQKRKHGYYVLPILYGSDMIGRIEFEKYKEKHPLIVKSIWFEDGVKITKTLQDKLNSALQQFSKYLGADRIEWQGNI